MDYDFSVLCNDQLEKVSKRLETLYKNFIKDYTMTLGVINNQAVNEKMGEILLGCCDIFRDQIKKDEIFWLETMNKVQRVLREHL